MTNFWTEYLFPFLTVLGLVILYFTAKNLLPSYFNEKGKNLATKEDISDLTQLVETVKYNFTKETEHLKSNLQFLTNIHGSLIVEERNAIVDLNEKYFSWLNLLLDTGFDNIDDTDNIAIDSYRKQVGQYYSSFLNSQTRFGLFLEYEDLSKYADKLKIETLKLLGTLATDYLLKIKHMNIEIDFMKKLTPLPEQSGKYKTFLDQRSELYTNFNHILIENYKIIAPMAHTFQKMCREYIYELIKKQSAKESQQAT